MSPHQSFLYEKGNEYYRYGKLFKIKIRNYPASGWLIEIYDELHSYSNYKIARDESWVYGRKIVKIIIPKGALYFESSDKTEIVSSKLWWP